ncbi:unnamed protein product [Prunus brigantina]
MVLHFTSPLFIGLMRPCPQLAHMDLIGFDNDKPPNYLLHTSGTNGTTAQLGEAINGFHVIA